MSRHLSVEGGELRDGGGLEEEHVVLLHHILSRLRTKVGPGPDTDRTSPPCTPLSFLICFLQFYPSSTITVEGSTVYYEK
jgi:hypothetical protein